MEKRVFIFMELADSDLHHLISVRKSIPENDLKPIMLQALIGLEYLHSMRVAHRDIKPANILLFGDVAKLTDYSLVREVGPDPVSLSGVGTRGYRAPELLMWNKIIGDIFKVDIWSLGITMFQSLTGARPDWRPEQVAQQAQQAARYARREEDPTPFVNEYDKMISQVMGIQKSPHVRQLMLFMLQFNPNNRPSANEAKSEPWFTEVAPPESRARTPGFDHDRSLARQWRSDDPSQGAKGQSEMSNESV